MVVVMVAVTIAIGCFLDLLCLSRNFDNPKFRDNLISQALIKMVIVTLLTTYLISLE